MKQMPKKSRLDNELVRRGEFNTIEDAIPFIMAGEVLVNGNVVYKKDHNVSIDDEIIIRKNFEYVSRGAYKLKKALEDFNFSVKGKNIVDIGISNGGFTDLLLQNGADRVLGVDVNINQVDYKLRNDKRVSLLKKNARYIKTDDVEFEPGLFTIDVSFISVIKILEALRAFGQVSIISLIKPQFEVSKMDSEKGGVIKSESKRIEILLDVKHKAEEAGYSLMDFTSSGIQGRKGNLEYFFYMKYGKNGSIDDKIIKNGIKK